jgi:transposase
MLGGIAVKQLWELHGQQRSIREIARTLGLSRNTVRKYLRTPGLPAMKPRSQRPSKLDAFREHIHRRLTDGLENCVVLLRELRAQGYTGGYSVLKDYVRPRRLRRVVKATMRFETKPGEQAQVDFGHFAFLDRRFRCPGRAGSCHFANRRSALCVVPSLRVRRRSLVRVANAICSVEGGFCPSPAMAATPVRSPATSSPWTASAFRAMV